MKGIAVLTHGHDGQFPGVSMSILGAPF